MTTLLYYLIHSLLSLLASVVRNELGNREGWSVSTKLTTLLYYLIHSLLPFLLPILLPNSFWRGRKENSLFSTPK